MKKIRGAILVTIVALLLLGAMALAQSGAQDAAEQGTLPGGGYHLTGLAWQVQRTISGGGYRLLGLARPALGGNGCCCTYLPCVGRRFH